MLWQIEIQEILLNYNGFNEIILNIARKEIRAVFQFLSRPRNRLSKHFES